MLFARTRFAENYKTLLSGLILGNVAGLMLFSGSYPPLRRFVETAFPFAAFGYYTGDFVLMAGLGCGLLIFPTLLALKSRQFYCLWSLLPIAITFLWLAIGCNIAHRRLKDFVDPPWVLFFLSWAISSFPISFFRWVRRTQKPAPQATKDPISNSQRYLLLSVIGIVFLSLTFLGWHNFEYPKPLHANVRVSFGKEAEVTVPLVEKNGGIFVMASLNGQRQLCQIDTGGPAVNWLRELHIVGEMTQERGRDQDAMGNSISSVTVKLPQIQIGSYKVMDMPTEMLDNDNGLFAPAAAPVPDGIPSLGNDLFRLAVITIDYQRKTLIIHPASYDLTKQRRRPGDKILQMGWTSHRNDSPARQQLFGWPVIRARVCGKPFWCVIDTGWEEQELGIKKDFFQQLPLSLPNPPQVAVGHFAYGIGSVPQIEHLSFQIAALTPPNSSIMLNGKGWIVPSLSGGEGIVGTSLMQQFRITLDYSRRRVLLEPYAHRVSEQKQEKRQAAPKLAGR